MFYQVVQVRIRTGRLLFNEMKKIAILLIIIGIKRTITIIHVMFACIKPKEIYRTSSLPCTENIFGFTIRVLLG